MNSAPGYLIDSDVLITAKNSYYAFTICPGFWKSLLHGHSHGHLHSIDRVKQELLRGHEDEDLVSGSGSWFLVSSSLQVTVMKLSQLMGGLFSGLQAVHNIKRQPRPSLLVVLMAG